MIDKKKELQIGDRVFYSLPEYETGKDIIYEGKVLDISEQTLHLKDKEFKMTIYKVNEGMGCQRNCLYTIDELWELKDRLEYLANIFTTKTHKSKEELEEIIMKELE